MHKLGVLSVWLGVLLSVLGVVAGFWQAIRLGQGEEWFMFVPVGFMLLLLGVTITQLHGKKEAE
jgi:uncharacterized membrane protein